MGEVGMTICPICRGAKWEDCFVWDWRNGVTQWTGSTPCVRCYGTGQVPDVSDYYRSEEEFDDDIPEPFHPTDDEIAVMDQWAS
jgi:hypothetical protein